MNEFRGRLNETWNGLSTLRKVLLVGSAGALFVIAFYMYTWSGAPSYVTLYSGLDPADSGEIVEELRSRGVPFELSAAGGTVRVPETQVDELRVAFAAQGLPEGGNTGFELFDGNALTATDFVQRLNFQRGLQGELSRTIETFDAVQAARVHVVLPERSLFLEDEQLASASVVLQLRPGMRLDTAEVRGIAQLVSGAVEGLEQSGVSIIDAGGGVLYDGATEGEAGLAGPGSQLDEQRIYERTLEHDVQALLDRALGLGRSAVSVRAVLNFDRAETETETFTPGENEDGVPRSQTSVTETYTANDEAVGGVVPGAVANIPGADGDLPGDATENPLTATQYSREENTTNFEVGRTVTRTVQAPGSIERISVSMLLDESVPAEQVESLTEAVSAAVGADPERGDVVAVSRLPFDESTLAAAEEAFAAEAGNEQILTYVRIALPILALIIAFFFFRMLTRSVSGRTYRVLDAPPLALAEARAALEANSPVTYERGVGAGATRRGLPAPQPGAERNAAEERVMGFATQEPRMVADLLQSWLKED